MKRFAAAALTAAIALSMTSTAFAARGWQQDDNGNFRFYLNDNVFVTSGYTEDGYYVDVNGIWDGSPSIGTRQEDGSYEIIVTPFDGLDIRGDMILKSKGNPVLDENNMWHVKVDVLDTGFATAGELRQIQAGDINFDACIATPNMMSKVGRLGRILGPRGLMPNPKLGTVTMDVERMVKELKAGRVEYRADRYGICHVPMGKVSFETEKLAENYGALLTELLRVKPSTAKGRYVKSVVFSSTMGPGVKVDSAITRNFTA